MTETLLLTPSDKEIEDLKNVIKGLRNFREEYYDPFDNYRYRTVLPVYLINKHVDPSLKYYSRRSGADFANSRTKGGEAKSTKLKRKKLGGGWCKGGAFEFCKQDEPVRRESLMNLESLLFGIFDHEEKEKIICAIYLNTEESVNGFLNIFKPKQEAFVKLKEQWDSEKRAMKRDTVQLSLTELLSINGSVIITGDGKIVDKIELCDNILKWKTGLTFSTKTVL